VALPSPAVTDPQQWPDTARVWLYKAGLSNDDIIRLGAYWHEDTQRVVLPVYRGSEVVYWQARDVSWTRKSRRPKYINPIVDKSRLCAKYGTGPVILLTEDILSAFRCSRVTEAWALMGTALAPGVLADLLQQKKPVVAMFDPDAGGQKANTATFKRLGLMGVPFWIARPKRDPKYLTKEETLSCVLAAAPPLAPLLLP